MNELEVKPTEAADQDENDELSYREIETQFGDIPPLDTSGAEQLSEEELEIFSGSLQPAQREQQRLEKKPDISHFDLGIVYDEETRVYTPLFEVGSKIVAERYASSLDGNPWLDTRVYTVLAIDDPAPGVVHCFEDEVKHHAYLGYSHPHTVIRLWTPPKRGKNPFKQDKAERLASLLSTPPTEISGDVSLVTPGRAIESGTMGNVKKRGRKPGTKNRSKDVIKTERLLKDAERAAKREAKRLKKKLQG